MSRNRARSEGSHRLVDTALRTSQTGVFARNVLHPVGTADIAAMDGIAHDAQSKSWALRGRMAARIKSAILMGSAWSLSHPTFGRPGHRYRSAASPTSNRARWQRH